MFFAVSLLNCPFTNQVTSSALTIDGSSVTSSTSLGQSTGVGQDRNVLKRAVVQCFKRVETHRPGRVVRGSTVERVKKLCTFGVPKVSAAGLVLLVCHSQTRPVWGLPYNAHIG